MDRKQLALGIQFKRIQVVRSRSAERSFICPSRTVVSDARDDFCRSSLSSQPEWWAVKVKYPCPIKRWDQHPALWQAEQHPREGMDVGERDAVSPFWSLTHQVNKQPSESLWCF